MFFFASVVMFGHHIKPENPTTTKIILKDVYTLYSIWWRLRKSTDDKNPIETYSAIRTIAFNRILSQIQTFSPSFNARVVKKKLFLLFFDFFPVRRRKWRRIGDQQPAVGKSKRGFGVVSNWLCISACIVYAVCIPSTHMFGCWVDENNLYLRERFHFVYFWYCKPYRTGLCFISS